MKKGMDAKQKAKTETIPYSISAYAVMLTLVSFLGFLIENTWIVLTEGFVDNRNMNAPFLIGYGDSAVDLPVYGNTGAAYGDTAVCKRLDQAREDQSVFPDLLFCSVFG